MNHIWADRREKSWEFHGLAGPVSGRGKRGISQERVFPSLSSCLETQVPCSVGLDGGSATAEAEGLPYVTAFHSDRAPQ